MPDFRTKTLTTEQANGEILLWQSRIRLGFALLIASIGIALLASDAVARISSSSVGAVVAYVLVTVLLTMLVRRTGEATEGVVLATVAADILFVFAITGVATPPEYYDRSLLLGIAILHLSEFYFGRKIAWGALVAIAAGYLGMIANVTGSGRPLEWTQELWTLGVFVLAASSFIIHYGSFKERLHRITMLFERAQDGDFSEGFDLTHEKHPDGVTMVGRAYNRVRGQLANLVLTDPLSGCLNRRGLEQQLKRELARAARTGKDVALLALDVDYFKDINDSWGHQAGDTVIQEVGALLRSLARGGDCVARTGGDEFTILLPETSAAGGFRLATRVRDAVSLHHFQGASKLAVSVSIGLVADRVHDENILHDLHSRADEALYAAKDAGRDRVSIWTPNLRALAVTRASQQIARAG
ncbi:MAG: GGDEF domain-containing protein [Gemmatimonadaceae bacterium]|nr:GGDEF domain-containing protein [Gemmatimonadaceae bacterium]